MAEGYEKKLDEVVNQESSTIKSAATIRVSQWRDSGVDDDNLIKLIEKESTNF